MSFLKILLISFVIVFGFAFFLGISTVYAEAPTDTYFYEGFEDCNLDESYYACSNRLYGDYFEASAKGYATGTQSWLGTQSISWSSPNTTSMTLNTVFDHASTTSQYDVRYWIYLGEGHASGQVITLGMSYADTFFLDWDTALSNDWDMYDDCDPWTNCSGLLKANIEENAWYNVHWKYYCNPGYFIFTFSDHNGNVLYTEYDTFTCGDLCYINNGKLGFDSHNQYLDEYSIYANYDWDSQPTAYVIDMPDWGATGSVMIGGDDIEIDNANCIVGQRCWFNIWYDYDSIGDTLHFWKYSTTTEAYTLYDSVQLSTQSELRFSEIVASSSWPGTDHYWIWNGDTGQEWDRYVYWRLPDATEDISKYCDDVEPSNGTYAGDFRYGIECGFRKMLGWAFIPSDSIKAEFYMQMRAMKEEFPLNIGFDLYEPFDEASTTASGMLTVPVLYWQDQGEYKPTSLASIEISTSTILKSGTGMIDDDDFSTWYTYVSYLIIGLTMIYFITRFMMLASKTNE